MKFTVLSTAGLICWLAATFKCSVYSFFGPEEWPASETESHSKVMRIKENDHQHKQLLIVKQILIDSTLGKYRDKYGEYAYWC